MSETHDDKKQVEEDPSVQQLSDEGVGGTIGEPDSFEPEESEGVDQPTASSDEAKKDVE